MNVVMVSGHLGQDMQVRAETDGRLIGEFSIACNDYAGKDDGGKAKYHTTWVTVVLYGNRVRALQDTLQKGRKVWVKGQLRTRPYKIAEERHIPWTYILCEDVELDNHKHGDNTPG